MGRSKVLHPRSPLKMMFAIGLIVMFTRGWLRPRDAGARTTKGGAASDPWGRERAMEADDEARRLAMLTEVRAWLG